MKMIFSILFSVAVIGGFNDIAKINSLKKQAKEAYNKGEYEVALKHFKQLSDSLNVKDDNILLNLANTYFKLSDTTNAINNYNSLLTSENKQIRSVAHQQLGIINNRDKKFKEALSHFKESLKADPSNEDSRYNYELLKKVLKEQEQQDQENQDQNKDQNQEDKKDQQDQENKDQQNKDQEKQNEEQQNKENQDQQDKEGQEKEEEQKDGEKKEEENKDGEKKEEEKENPQEQEGDQKEEDEQESQEPSFSDKLEEMNISEEKAKMILEAMKNNEIQYYQQNKRKAQKKKDTSKPDW